MYFVLSFVLRPSYFWTKKRQNFLTLKSDQNFDFFFIKNTLQIEKFVKIKCPTFMQLKELNKKNEILITQETYMLTSKYIQTKTTQKIKAKGFTRLIQTYSVTALKSEKILSSESNKLLKDILENIPSKDIKLQDEVIEFMSEIKGVNNEKLF